LGAQHDKKLNQQFFFRALIAVFTLRFILAAWMPMTGDEAYFILWGKNLDYGYYDHTPFVGWLLAALLTVSDAAWWLRLPSVVLPVVVSFCIYRLLLPRQPQVAIWVALVYLVAPVNIVNFLITTDTPLIIFSFISASFFYRALYKNSANLAEKDHTYLYFSLAGLFLGLAFFSKYFAVFLGIAYGIYILVFHRTKRGFAGLGLILLLVAPFVFINLLWNYNHCWNNILFNLFNRTAGADDPLSSLGKYLGMLVYLFSPFLIYYIYKNKSELKKHTENKFNRVYLWLAAVPLTLFLVLLLRKEVGLHWVFSFYPFAFIAFAGLLSVKQWRRTFHFMWLFSLLHVIGLISVMTLPVETFVGKKEAVQNLVFGKYSPEVLAELKPYEKDYTFGTISYGMSSVASYYSRRHFIVFDRGSYHAREDERLTNYKDLDGKNILIFKRTAINLDYLSRYFESSERKTLKVRKATFELLLGNNFNYDLYRKEILTDINRDFYAIPEWLPVGQCEFKYKYGFM
jgi:hypothetical protein